MKQVPLLAAQYQYESWHVLRRRSSDISIQGPKDMYICVAQSVEAILRILLSSRGSQALKASINLYLFKTLSSDPTLLWDWPPCDPELLCLYFCNQQIVQKQVNFEKQTLSVCLVFSRKTMRSIVHPSILGLDRYASVRLIRVDKTRIRVDILRFACNIGLVDACKKSTARSTGVDIILRFFGIFTPIVLISLRAPPQQHMENYYWSRFSSIILLYTVLVSLNSLPNRRATELVQYQYSE